ncbi:MAG: VWA domain-containing protein [Acidobacteriota bacterium]|nr:VWA domain-containing protein [Acidobacteriota bacterium]
MRTALIALAVFLSTAAFAQQTARETIEVRITNVDVVVTDRAGNPAVGLTADDFELLEAGKPQKITNFYEVRDLPATMTTAAQSTPATTAAPAAVPAAAPPIRRRLILFVDNTSVDPHARSGMLASVERSLNNFLREGDEAMLVFFDGVSANVLAPLTSDRAALVAKLSEASKRSGTGLILDAQKNTILENAQNLLNSADKYEGDTEKRDNGPVAGTPEQSDSSGRTAAKMTMTMSQAYSMSMSAAQSFSEQVWRAQRSLLAALGSTIDGVAPAEGKKLLLFIGGELSENPGADIYERVNAIYAPHLRMVRPIAARDNSRSLSGELTALARRANAAGVTMYMVDASDRRLRDASSGRIDRSDPEPMSSNDTAMAMRQVATMTGGLWVPGGKTIQAALDTIAKDVSAYYSLGYASQAQGKAPIEVRVKRPGLRVRMRQSYTEGAQAQRAAATTPALSADTPAADAVIATPEDLVKKRVTANLFDEERSDFAVSVAASPRVPQDGGRSQVVLTITFPTTVTLNEDADSLKGSVAIYIVTSNDEGRTSKVAAQVQELKFPRGTRAQVLAQKKFTMTFPMVIGSGNVKVSVAVADQQGGTIGFARTTIPE